jgi:hypothetical protein
MDKIRVAREPPPQQQRPIGNPSDAPRNAGSPPTEIDEGLFYRGTHKVPPLTETNGVVPEGAWQDRLIYRSGGQGR